MNITRIRRQVISAFVIVCSILAIPVVHAALTCTVGTSCAGTTVFKMQATTNAHAELNSQSNYTQLVCCSGVAGLGTSCSGVFATVAKLSGTTNAHVELGTQSNYANSSCLSISSGTVSVGYQTTNCTGFDTTVASMSGATTNAHVGDGSAYTNKICATAAAAAGSLTLTASSTNSFNSAITVAFASQTSTISNIGAIKASDSRGGAPGWTLSMAAADWKSGQDVMQLDYDGSGSDGNLGKLCPKPANGTLYAETGSLTGVSKGTNQCFSAGVTSITIVSATNGNGTGDYWLTDMPAEQFFPSSPTPQSYTTTIVLTLSMAHGLLSLL